LYPIRRNVSLIQILSKLKSGRFFNMARYGFCWDERDHKERARRDAQYGRKDHEYYDRCTMDPCKEAYTEEYNREQRRIEQREYERQEEERREHDRQERAARQAREQREQDEWQQQERERYEMAQYEAYLAEQEALVAQQTDAEDEAKSES
jgi:hypothetical protein